MADRFLYFRFLVPLPLEVVFLSARFTVAFRSIEVSANAHEVKAKHEGTAGYVAIGGTYTEREWVEVAAYKEGIRVRLITVGETIMRRLVREGRAEIVPAPVDDPLQRRKRDPGRLYT